MQATTQLMVQRSLNLWLGSQINLQNVTVTAGPGGDYSQILVEVSYILIETQSSQTAQLVVS